MGDAAERETKTGQVASDGATCKQQENELDKLENKEQGKLHNNRNKESNNCIESEPHRTQIEARRQPTSSSSTPRRHSKQTTTKSTPVWGEGQSSAWGAQRARMANVKAGRNVVCVRHFVYRLATSTRYAHQHTQHQHTRIIYAEVQSMMRKSV